MLVETLQRTLRRLLSHSRSHAWALATATSIVQGTFATLVNKLSRLARVAQGSETFQPPQSRGKQDAATTLRQVFDTEYRRVGETVDAALLRARGQEEERFLQRWNETKPELQLMLASLDVRTCVASSSILRHQG